ncbi:hypothetical protein ACT3TZ_11430 [Brachybacterium sp. AOP25-B2-12]|uniref:hypothetical protein n=1 Tax=Brachybacterium sp. AOP25-B2-12 TaxID=3457710 RepID=UPI004034908F
MNPVEMLVIRWTGLMLAVVFVLRGQWVEAAVSMLVALVQVLAWRTRLPRPWEVYASLTSLLAAVSSFFLLYERIGWWDVPVHILTTGAVAVLAGWVLRRERLRGRLIVACGMVLSLVWEGLELWGHVVVDPRVYVAVWDTVGDVASGALGSVIAAWVWTRWIERSAVGAVLRGSREHRLDR